MLVVRRGDLGRQRRTFLPGPLGQLGHLAIDRRRVERRVMKHARLVRALQRRVNDRRRGVGPVRRGVPAGEDLTARKRRGRGGRGSRCRAARAVIRDRDLDGGAEVVVNQRLLDLQVLRIEVARRADAPRSRNRCKIYTLPMLSIDRHPATQSLPRTLPDVLTGGITT